MASSAGSEWTSCTDLEDDHANSAGAGIAAITRIIWFDPSYDAAGRMTGLVNARLDGTLISRFTCTYDNVGNRTAVRLEVRVK